VTRVSREIFNSGKVLEVPNVGIEEGQGPGHGQGDGKLDAANELEGIISLGKQNPVFDLQRATGAVHKEGR